MATAPGLSFLGTVVGSRAVADFLVVDSCFKPHQHLSSHRHERAFISVALHGAYLETCRNKTSECVAGRTIFHVAGESHSNRFYENGGEVISVEMGHGYLARLTQAGVPAETRFVLQNLHSHQLALRLRQEISMPDAISGVAIEGLALELLAEVFRQGQKKSYSPKGAWVETVREVLNESYRERITLSELARTVDVHPMHLARAFRQAYRCSVGEYVRKLRVTAASRDLVHSDLSLAEIASKHGFSDQSHLSRLLKKHMSLSPYQYRRRCKLNPCGTPNKAQ